MPTRSAANMGWTGVTFTYGSGPTVITIGECEEIDVDTGGERKTYKGGNSPGVTHQKLVNQHRSVTLKAADVSKLAKVPQGIEGVLVAIFNDEHNNEGVGALTLTLSTALCHKNKYGGKEDEYGKADLTFDSRWIYSGSAWVDPLAIVEA